VSNRPHYFIRPGMDVYNALQDRYLGSVVRVIHNTPTTPADRVRTAAPSSSAHDAGTTAPSLSADDVGTVAPSLSVDGVGTVAPGCLSRRMSARAQGNSPEQPEHHQDASTTDDDAEHSSDIAEHSRGSAPIVHEEGAVTGHAEPRGNRTLGEDLGPVPTARFGNTGPHRQSAGQEYATNVRDLQPDVSHFLVRPGRINLGFLTRPFTVPSSAVLSTSMERIVIDWE
jgi:hypothetical protein